MGAFDFAGGRSFFLWAVGRYFEARRFHCQIMKFFFTRVVVLFGVGSIFFFF